MKYIKIQMIYLACIFLKNSVIKTATANENTNLTIASTIMFKFEVNPEIPNIKENQNNKR